MQPIEKLYYLLDEYIKGNYDDNGFCDQFTIIYNLEVDYSKLGELEHKLFRELSVYTARFSPYEEDLAIPNVYFSGKQVKSKALEVSKELMAKKS